MTLENVPVQRAVLAALDTANGDFEKAKKNLEHWYDSVMDRVSGRYKRSTQLVLFLIGIVIATGFNIDTISLADYLYRNETQRGAIVAQAGLAVSDRDFLKTNYGNVKQQIDDLQLPIGWDFEVGQITKEDAEREAGTLVVPPAGSLRAIWMNWHAWFMKPLGWLLTAFAVTLGAPFWFDILNKIMIIRSTVKPHEKSPEEASEDRQGDRSESVRATAMPASVQIVREVQPAPPAPAATAPDMYEDGCDATVTQPTLDNQLPAAQGGVI